MGRRKGVGNRVSVGLPKKLPVNISIPPDLLRAVSERAISFGVSRSVYICYVLREDISKPRKQIVLEAQVPDVRNKGKGG
jgi:hypothetical protein